MKFGLLFSSFLALTGQAQAQAQAKRLFDELAPRLSSQGLISTEAPVRWSSFDAPAPSIVVNAATESDVANTVCDMQALCRICGPQPAT